MKIYRVQYHSDHQMGEHAGFRCFGTLREARAAVKNSEGRTGHVGTAIETIELRCTKSGVIRAFNIHGSHPDNG